MIMAPTRVVATPTYMFLVLKYTNAPSARTIIPAKIIPDVLSVGSPWATQSIIHMNSRALKVITAAITWFSVKVDIKSPMEIKAEPNSKNPIYPPTISHVARFPKKDRMMGYMQVMRRVKTNTDTAAKYLPRTMPVKEVGLVNNS